jgi:uncharacterized protein (TIGR02391 family)
VTATLREWPYDGYYRWLNELIGYIQAILGRQAGQRGVLIGEEPFVDGELRRGAYDSAVLAAARLLEEELQTKSGSGLMARQLAAESLKPGTGNVIVVCGGSQQDERQFQEGVQLLTMGAFVAFRNPNAHGVRLELTREDAEHQVGLLLYLRAVISQGGTFGVNLHANDSDQS